MGGRRLERPLLMLSFYMLAYHIRTGREALHWPADNDN